MKKFIYPFAALALMIASAFTVIKSQDWKIADGYAIKFDGGDPAGEFKGLKGTVSFDPAALATSKFDVSVDVASINTGNGMKNTHAKSDAWFDATKYPTIAFTSTSITKTPTGYLATGSFTMHGVTKPAAIPFTFANNTFTGSFEVNRMDYGIAAGEPNHGAQKFKVDVNVPVTK